MLRIWRKQKDGPHDASSWWIQYYGLREEISWHCMGALIRVEQYLNNQGYLSIIADEVFTVMLIVFPAEDRNFQQDNAPCYKATIVRRWFEEHESEFPSFN